MPGSGNLSDPCDDFQTLKYTILSGLRAFLALFSFISCLLVVILILLFKRYHFFVQRLVLYVCIIAAINSIAIIAQKVDYFDPNTQQEGIIDKYCIFSGFFELYTSLVELLILLCITHGLYHSVIKQKPKKYLEGIYVSISLLLPLVIACIPFFGLSYGKSGPWCWIRERDSECDPYLFGIILQFAIWYIPLVAITIIILSAYVATLCKLRNGIENHWQGPYDPEVLVQRGRLRKVVKIMLAYLPVLYLVVNLFSLPNAIYWAIGERPIFALWVLHAILPPLRGALFAIPYLFHTDTRRQLNKISLRAAVTQRLSRKQQINSYPAKECTFSDSLTFPATADTTIERNRVYRNPSLRLQPSEETSPKSTNENDLNPLNEEERVEMGLSTTLSQTSTVSSYIENEAS